MAPKKISLQTIAGQIQKLAERMGRGFAAVAEAFSNLATKADVGALGEQLTSIESELKSINRRLDLLEEEVGGLKGFAKEIDELRARIAHIEKHLGIDKKIAA
jgi:predicted  nucleic acid-binding Zn-ribbon protein